MSFSHEITISNIPADKVQKCKIAGNAEVVDALVKRVVLVNRDTMELIAARNVDKGSNSWKLFCQDIGDEKFLLIGFDEGRNFNVDAFDRLSLGTTTFTADPAEFEKVLSNATAYYVEEVIPFKYQQRIINLDGETDVFTPLEGIYFVEDVQETVTTFAEGHFEDESGNTLDLSSSDYSFLKKEVSFKISDSIFKIREVKADNTTVVLYAGTDLTERVLVDAYSSVLNKESEFCGVGQDIVKFLPSDRTFSVFKDNAPASLNINFKTNIQIENAEGETDEFIYEQANPVYSTISKDSVNSYAENIKIGVDLSKIPEVFDEITDYTDLSVVFQASLFLDIEVERFDSENKKGLIWFNLPYISDKEDTYFALLYPYTKSNVFITETSHEHYLYQDNLFVYHMTDLPEGTGAVRDSSPNANHATPSGMTAANQSFGILGSPEYNFTGSEIINAGNIIPEKIREGTIETVFKTTSNKAHLLSQDSSSVGDRDVNLSIGKPTGVLNTVPDGCLNFEVNGNLTGETRNIVSATPVNDNQYHYLGISFYNGVFGMIIDENKNVPFDYEYKAFGNTDNFLVGTDGTNYLSGTVKEVLISDKFIDAEALNLINKSMQDSLIEYNSQDGGIYRYSKTITIDHTKVDGDLTHFPVAIKLGTDCGINSADTSDIFTELGENKYKISVQDSSGTELYVEIEEWDSVNNRGLLWVSRDGWIISSTEDTELTLFFDASVADNTAYIGTPGNRTEVWNSDFEAVYTMSQDPSGGTDCIIDSSGNGNHGTPHGSMTSADLVDGPIGKAIDFDGSDDYIDLGELPEKTKWLWRSVVKGFTITGQRIIISNDFSGWNDDVLIGIDPDATYTTNDKLGCCVQDSGAEVRTTVEDSSLIDSNTWYVLAVESDGSSLYLYVDGVLVDSTTKLGDALTYGGNTGQKSNIGRNPRGYWYWDGLIKNVVFANNRGATWIKADYHAQTDNLLTFSDTQISLSFITAKFTSKKDLNNVPLRLKLSSTSGTTGFDTAEVLTNSSNLTVLRGVQNLKTERSFWELNTYAELWTLFPQIKKGENVFTISQGGSANPDIGDIGSAQGQEVFKDFKAVYHLNQDPAAIKDSTGNNPDAIAYNLTATDVSKDGAVLNGTNQYIDLGQITTEELSQGQVHLSFKTTDTNKPILTKGTDTFKLSSTGTLDIDLNETINSEITLNDNSLQTASFSFDKHKTDLVISGTDEFEFKSFGSNGLADILIGGNYLGPNFEGSIVDLRFNTKSRYQDDLVLQGKMWKETLIQDLNEPQIIPAFSFDNGSTFNTYVNNAWKAVVTKDEAVHLVSGDSDWYYIDDSGTWNKAFQNNSNFALKQAMQFQENMCHVVTVRNLTSAEWTSTGGMTAEGNIQIAFCYNSKIKNLCPSITDVNVDDKIILSCQSYDLEPYSTKITGSKIEWEVRILEGVNFDPAQIEVHSVISGGTWQPCTRNESIPDIVPGMDTTGKELQFKIVVPKDIPESVIINLVPKIQ
ncbi:MAG: LamG-like jellyroll fold domain-containing protein [Desulfobacteraceae bacterium]